MTENKIKKLVDEFGQIIRWPKKPVDKEVVIKFLSIYIWCRHFRF